MDVSRLVTIPYPAIERGLAAKLHTMTSKELNRDIARLHKAVKALDGNPDRDNIINTVIRKEFLRLYRADNTFEYMNIKSLRIMLRLNLLYRFEPLHTFGIYIEL
jgi:hypothetical protein